MSSSKIDGGSTDFSSQAFKSDENLAKALSVKHKDLEAAMQIGEVEYKEFIIQRLEDLSSKLLIGPSILLGKYENEGEQGLTDYLQKKQSKYGLGGTYDGVMEEARKQYATIIDKPLPPKLNKHEVMKAYRLSLRHLSTDSGGYKEGGAAFSFKSKHFLTGMNKEGRLQLIKWSGRVNTGAAPKHPDHLGAGTFGVAQKVYDIANAQFAALKIAKPKTGSTAKVEIAERDVINEATKLAIVHKDGTVEGLQEEYRYVFNLTANVSGDDIKIVGVMGRLYNQGDLITLLTKSTITPNVQQKRAMAHQLFNGLTHMHKLMIHGDIKLENIFLRYDPETKQWYVYIADFGDAKNKKTEFTLKNMKLSNRDVGLGTTASPGYFTEEDLVQSSTLVEKYDNATTKEKKDKIDKKWVGLQEKRDVFATATCAWALLTGDMPYELEEFNDLYFPYTYYGIDRYKKDKVAVICGNTTMNLLVRALDEDPSKRPSANELKAALSFTDAFKESGISTTLVPIDATSLSDTIVKASKQDKEFELINDNGEFKLLHKTDFGYSIKNIDIGSKKGYVLVDGEEVTLQDLISTLRSETALVKFEELPIMSLPGTTTAFAKQYTTKKLDILIRKSGDNRSLVVACVNKKTKKMMQFKYPPRSDGKFIVQGKERTIQEIIELYKSNDWYPIKL